MAIWRAQVEIGAASGMPEDKIVNTFHFEGSETATDLANIDDMISDFYDANNASGRLFASYSSGSISNQQVIKIFCLADPEPREPRGEFFHNWTRGTGTTLPSEVALCMSYQAAPLAGMTQRRRRGRIYLGPFLATTNVAGRPQQALRQVVAESAENLRLAANASVTWQWVVYSRANDAGYDVVGGWVDNAWDSQRRRGVKATERIEWGAS